VRVLHILDHSLPVYDGYSFRSHNILRAQQDAGVDVAVTTSPKHEASWSGVSPAEEVIDGVRHYRTGPKLRSSVPFLGERRLMKALERRLLAAAETEGPDILHAHSPVLNAIPALRVGRRLGLPVVYEIRAFWEDAAADQGSYAEGSLKYRLVRAVETRCCRRADAVVTICQGLREDLLSRGIPADKVTVVPNAVRADEFRSSPPDEELRSSLDLGGKQVVGFLGSFYHFEGLDLLLQSAARLQGEVPEFRLLLVGGGEMDERLRARAQELGLDGTALFTGRLPHERMPGVYALVDVLAYPRKPMRLTELVTPLKPLEAMAMGKALVASDVGGHRELIQDGVTGLLHRAGQVEDLARALAKLLREPAVRARLGEAGRQWVARERTWSGNATRYGALYDRLLSSRRL
jgi:PEP-CTERM/exosortase A-associated glycosyltransferase